MIKRLWIMEVKGGQRKFKKFLPAYMFSKRKSCAKFAVDNFSTNGWKYRIVSFVREAK